MTRSFLPFAVGFFFLCIPVAFLPGADPDQPPRTLSASGKVVDATGKPVAGCTGPLPEWAPVPKTHQPHEQEIKDLLATTTPDEQGAFAFGKVPLPKPYLDELARTMPAPWDLLVTAKGHGLAWERLP